MKGGEGLFVRQPRPFSSLILAGAVALLAAAWSACDDSAGPSAPAFISTLAPASPGSILPKEEVEDQALQILEAQDVSEEQVESAVLPFDRFLEAFGQTDAAPAHIEPEREVWVVLVHADFTAPSGPAGAAPETYKNGWVVFDAQTGEAIGRGGIDEDITLPVGQ